MIRYTHTVLKIVRYLWHIRDFDSVYERGSEDCRLK
jgi:hypothetical protein